MKKKYFGWKSPNDEVKSSYRGYSKSNINKSIDLLGYNCQLCGSPMNVQLHHKDMNPFNNEVSNWQRLCGSCHRYLHARGSIPSPEEQEQMRTKREEINKYKIKKKTLKRNIPLGFYNSKETAKLLKISRQRLHQIKDRLLYKKMHRGDISKRPVYIFDMKSVLDYTLSRLPDV
jgi:hypothetical protein